MTDPADGEDVPETEQSRRLNVRPDDRWLDTDPVTDGVLPPDVADRFDRLLGHPIETMGDVVSGIRTSTGGPLTADHLCHTTTETPHVAVTDGETYHFQCFFDGIGLAALVDGPVEISTESPAGEPIDVRATPKGAIESTPPEAVMSFGIGGGVDEVDPDRSTSGAATGAELAYGLICPYVRAFTDRSAYERWAARVEVATVGMALTDGVPIATALVADE